MFLNWNKLNSTTLAAIETLGIIANWWRSGRNWINQQVSLEIESEGKK